MHTRLFISLKPPRARCQTAARTPRCADARTSPRWQTRRALRIHGREPSARVTEEKPINNTLSHPPARRAPRVCMRGGGGLRIAAPKVHTNEPRIKSPGQTPREEARARVSRHGLRGGGGLRIAARKSAHKRTPHQIARADTAGRSPADPRCRRRASTARTCAFEPRPIRGADAVLARRGRVLLNLGRSAVPTPC